MDETQVLEPEVLEPEAAETETMAPTIVAVPTRRRWRAVMVVIGRPTDDGRQFDAITWRDPPLSLLWQIETADGHDGAVVVGRVDAIYPDAEDQSVIWAEGVFDVHSEMGRECLRLVDEQMLRGVSVDAAVLDALIEESGLRRFSGKVGALTVCAFPAFEECQIMLLDDEPAEDEAMPMMSAEAAAGEAEEHVARTESSLTFDRAVSLIASGIPVGAPPREWFDDPGLGRRSGFHVTDDGRIFGHLYGWGECHVGSPPGRCVQVPRGGSYRYITGVDGRGVRCADGTFVQTGPLCIAADHADLELGWVAAKDHYAHTSLAVADVVCGEDQYGIWVAGAVRPGITDEQLHVVRASAPSGDWRFIGGRLELILPLMVNMPGFPALAASGAPIAFHIEDGEVTALVVRSEMAGEDCGCGGEGHAVLDDVLARLSAAEAVIGRITAAERAEVDAAIVRMEADLGLDPESLIARMETTIG
jgi:hypothetical protein